MTKARVYKARWGWHWEHSCTPSWLAEGGFPHLRWDDALKGALKHVKECS